MRGYLSVPVEAGRHPAVVMMPSCEGRKAYQQSWAQALSERGFVALVVDDYFMQDRGRTCGIREPAAQTDLLRRRLLNALGAASYLSARPEVDGGRMAVMGWGDAPVGALVGDIEAVGSRRDIFKAAVAATPMTCYGRGRSSSRPMLVLQAESDGTGPGNSCDAPADTPALEVRIYEGTLPGFDDPQAGLAGASASGPLGTAGRRYDRLAHVRAIENVAAFLNRRLPAGPSDGEHQYAASRTPAVSELGIWAVDPNAPGPDLPPVGRSAFDATGTLSIGGDFRPVASTLERLAADASASSPLRADRFDGASLSGWLLAELGVLPASRCCNSRPTPEPRLDAETDPTDTVLSVALEHRGPLLTFRRYCGACHGGDTTNPPGFLYGGGETILSTVAQCAERIYYRLSMWHRPSEDQAVPPMPPVQGLSLAGTTTDDWRQSESLERLTAYARKLVIEEGRDPGALLEGSYRATRACLANRDELSARSGHTGNSMAE